MSELRGLYQEVILDHSKNPRNHVELPTANRKADGHNPLCGDKITVYLRVKEDVIEELSFLGVGCAISTASASLMTESLRGKTLSEAAQLFEDFHSLATGKGGEESKLGRLVVFQGVSEFPVRVKCATLAWHTLHAAIVGKQPSVTTE